MSPEEAIRSLALKFSSGNPIPVGRATILREEWKALSEYIKQLEEYKWRYEDLQK